MKGKACQRIGLESRRVEDIELSAVIDRCSAYTPVPDGVGPMTIAMLIQQTVDAVVSAATA